MSPEHDLVLWSDIDPGPNVHIVFDYKMLHNYRRETIDKSAGQVSGDRKAVAGIGDWHVEFDGFTICLQNFLCMPDSPSCTLSTGALKRSDEFISAAHGAMDHLHLVCPIGIHHKYFV